MSELSNLMRLSPSMALEDLDNLGLLALQAVKHATTIQDQTWTAYCMAGEDPDGALKGEWRERSLAAALAAHRRCQKFNTACVSLLGRSDLPAEIRQTISANHTSLTMIEARMEANRLMDLVTGKCDGERPLVVMK